MASREIPLTQGKVTLVSEEDYERLSRFSWYAMQLYPGKFYAARWANGTNRYMSHDVIGRCPWRFVDHRDGDTLNNQRHNLRHATQSQNSQNMNRSSTKKSSRFKGVFWHARSQKWRPMIRVNGRLLCFGLFISEDDAAKAYDAKAVEHFGQFAKTNFNMEERACQNS